jgi:hypothetical protein
MLGNLPSFSGRGEIPHRRYGEVSSSPRALAHPYGYAGTSRSGAMPEPTVKVRMEENADL